MGAVKRMAAYFTGKGKRLPKLSSGRIEGRTASAEVLDPGAGVAEARLWYTLDDCATSLKPSVSGKATWRSAPASVRDGRVVAEVPAGTKVCYLSAYEKEQPDRGRNYMCGSSAFLFGSNQK